ncbi:MAG: hypothetical protein QOE90_773 [Thermoplasmata archaeon]|jgi:hypothetical protein|nr:hypothetical protein [Thermoplasmata archaeon]
MPAPRDSPDNRKVVSLEAQRALADGQLFVKNAEEEMDRKILREDQLYFIDNQVEAIDTFLADTEDLNGNHDVKSLRDNLRTMKQKLEKKSMEFLAQQEGGDLPEDLPPAEMAEAMVAYGKDFIEMADEALKTKVKAVDQVAAWEDPLATLNSFLADSETLVTHHKPLAKVREDVRARKMELQKRIADVVQAWRQSDLAGGADEDD